LAKLIDLSEKFGLTHENELKILGMIINGDERDPVKIAEAEKLIFTQGEASLEDIVKIVAHNNQTVMQGVKTTGNRKPLKFLVSEVMKMAGEKRGNKDKVKEILDKLIMEE
jgi:Asp-tRNA(Asn)/Glu-tRNA(Gln) amidotransferase B subunit